MPAESRIRSAAKINTFKNLDSRLRGIDGFSSDCDTEGVKKLTLSRHPGENRGPGNWQSFENTGFRLSPE
jgi:hypothetical protein